MEPIISKEEFDEFMKIKGEMRGAAFIEHKKFILKEKGEEGLKKMEEAIVRVGYPEYKEIKPTNFYPIGLNAVNHLVIKRLFNFDDKKFEELGRFGGKLSMIIRFLMKYFVSLEKAVKAAPRMWRAYHTVGDLKVVEYDEKKRYIILRLENFHLHPIHCKVLKGYFPSIVGIIVKDKVTHEETKCVYRGDEYHEFLLKW